MRQERRVLIVGPNGGVALSNGGGAAVALHMAETLLRRPNVRVDLAALTGLDPETLDSIHGTTITPMLGSRAGFHYLAEMRPDFLRGFLPPYAGLVMERATHFLRRTIEQCDPQAVVFHDDIPKGASTALNRRLSYLYVHFSYVTRVMHGDPEDVDSISLSSISERLFRRFLASLLLRRDLPCEEIWVNSTVTAEFVRRAWPAKKILVIHPPVRTSAFRVARKEPGFVCSVGAIQPNKRHMDAIEAIARADKRARLVILGNTRDQAYLAKIHKRIKALHLSERVTLFPNAPRDTLIALLSSAQAIVHAARFEPFGISVVEGMASGAIPIVYRGELSGPWRDILDRGSFGIGFRTIDDLARSIESLLDDEERAMSLRQRAIERATRFDQAAFSSQFNERLSLET